MKYLNKILYLFLVSAIFTSCNRDIIETDFDSTNTLFFSNSSGTLLVEDGASNVFDVIVSATALASMDTPYTISVDNSSTAVEGVDFDIVSTSNKLSKGEIVTEYSLVADFNNAAVSGKTVVLNLSSTSASVSEVKKQYTLNLIKLCPLNADFTGSYALSIVSNGIFNTPTFTPGVVTLSEGATPTDRVFSVAPYPAFGSFAPIEFKFSLICNNVVVSGLQATGVGCGSSTTLGPAATTGSYNDSNDSVIQIILKDDEDGNSCGGSGNVTAEILLTKL